MLQLGLIGFANIGIYYTVQPNAHIYACVHVAFHWWLYQEKTSILIDWSHMAYKQGQLVYGTS